MTTSDFLKQWNDVEPTITAHTSGSTGTPKEIRLSKADMELSARATLDFLGLSGRRGLNFVMPLSADYIAGKMMIVRALLADARLWELTPSNNPLHDFDADVDIDLLPVVPSQLPALLDDPRLGRVKCLIVGGAPMSPEVETRLARCRVNAFATYGMTETCSHVAMRRVGEPLYRAMPGITFETVDDDRLVIVNPRATYRRLETNDVVDLVSPTSFVWLGRADNVINSGGFKLYPEEIERAIAPVMGAREYYVTSRPSRLWGSEAVLMVEGALSLHERGQIAAGMRSLLSSRQVPKDIIAVANFTRTASGKIKRVKA